MNDARVIVGISPSLSGLAAVRFALAESRRRDIPLWAVRAWHIEFGPRARPTWEMERAVDGETRRLVEETVRLATGREARELGVVIRTPQGPAGAVLLDYASREDDLLVLGAQRSRWWGGKVVRTVASRAACPVIVIPPPEMSRMSSRRIVKEVTGGLPR